MDGCQVWTEWYVVDLLRLETGEVIDSFKVTAYGPEDAIEAVTQMWSDDPIVVDALRTGCSFRAVRVDVPYVK